MIINLNVNKEEPAENPSNAQDLLEMQKETIEMQKEYLTNLIPKMKGMVVELRTDIKEDSWEFLRMMVDGFNWVVEGFNGIEPIINTNKEIDVSATDKLVNQFGISYRAKDAEATASALENDIIPFLEKLQTLLLTFEENK
ncbi:MAG: hypothetical protein ACI4DU_02515 [Lachnospiraceae bacterium]